MDTISSNNHFTNNGNGLQQYNIDSDSDSDDEAAPVVPSKSLTSGYSSQTEEFKKLKDQSAPLLDGKWRENRNKQLLKKMLDLDEPTITAKMVEFLLQEGVCDVLIKFITHMEPESLTDNLTDIYKLSYKTTMLIAPDEPSDSVHSFLSKRANVIIKNIFEVFREDFKGSFHHPHRVLETLLRFYPSEVYDGITSDGKLESRLSNLLKYIGFPPVADMLVMLVALTPVPRHSSLYISSSRPRWVFADKIANWIFLQKLVETFIYADQRCVCNDTITPLDHKTAVAQAFQDIIERLCVEDLGELLLQPIGHIPEIVKILVDTFIQPTNTLNIRAIALRLLSFLLRKSTEESFQVNLQPQHPSISIGGPTTIMNRLHPQRHKLLKFIRSHFPNILSALVTLSESEFSTSASVTTETNHNSTSTSLRLYTVRHPGHVTSVPFSSLRMNFVELLVLLVESEDGKNFSEDITEQTWRLLMAWVVQYPHTNIYHALFHRLIFTIVRKGYDEALKTLMQKAKFVNFLIENFQLPSDMTSLYDTYDASSSADPHEAPRLSISSVSSAYSDDSSLESRHHTNSVDSDVDSLTREMRALSTSRHHHEELTPELKLARDMVRGLLMNICNVLRLQMEALPPSAYLRIFLSSHQKWAKFTEDIRACTEHWQNLGMGINCPAVDNKDKGGPMLAALTLMSAAEDGEGIDHGSRFAKSLGFDGEIAWPSQPSDNKKKSKNKKSKKKKSNSKRRSKSESKSEDDLPSSEKSDDAGEVDEDEDDDSGNEASGSSTSTTSSSTSEHIESSADAIL